MAKAKSKSPKGGDEAAPEAIPAVLVAPAEAAPEEAVFLAADAEDDGAETEVVTEAGTAPAPVAPAPVSAPVAPKVAEAGDYQPSAADLAIQQAKQTAHAMEVRLENFVRKNPEFGTYIEGLKSRIAELEAKLSAAVK